jgi:hypothetical protein
MFMPPRFHTSAPSFDPTCPRELRYYFDELDTLFSACHIVSDSEKKNFALRYLDTDSFELWELLSEFSPSFSYLEFVAAVYKLYPEAISRWSYSDMENLVVHQATLEIRTFEDLGQYYRSFLLVTQFLRSTNRISEFEQSRAFVRGFQSEFWNRIAFRLQIKFPDHYPDDPYIFEDIYAAATFVVQSPSSLSTSSIDS